MNGSRQSARFARFNLVGVLGAGLQIVVFELLIKYFRTAEVVATPIAVEIVILHNFFWHERFTWHDQQPGGLQDRIFRLWRFHAGNGLISLVGNTGLTYCLVEQLRSPALLAAVAAIAICAPVNFLIADRWVYVQKLQAKAPAPQSQVAAGL
jgi:dolichol-phosphate mannosyltransferase